MYWDIFYGPFILHSSLGSLWPFSPLPSSLDLTSNFSSWSFIFLWKAHLDQIGFTMHLTLFHTAISTFVFYRTKSSKNIFPSLSSSIWSNSASQSMSSSFPTHWRTSLIFSSLRKRFFFIVFFGFTSSLWKSCKKYQTNICLYRTLTWDLHCSQWSV